MRSTPGTPRPAARWGRAIDLGHDDIDGLLFSSRLTGADIYAVFDRGTRKLYAEETGALPDHPDLPTVPSMCSIRLIAA